MIQFIPPVKTLINKSFVLWLVSLLLPLVVSATVKEVNLIASDHMPAGRDIPVESMLKSQLLKHRYDLSYPLSVERFYRENGFKLSFVAPETVKTHAADAMMLLDCVIQYGLNPADYHPNILTYERLDKLTKLKVSEGIREKVFFDMMLTDAMMSLINNLHYGKLNPYHSTNEIDAAIGLNAVTNNVLRLAFAQTDFTAAIARAQPKSVAYNNLQRHMHLLKGVYMLDCYETPDSTIRAMAINMERLRWIQHDSTNYIDINLPAFVLSFHTKDTTIRLDIAIGTPVSPTPVLKGIVNYLNIRKNKPDNFTQFIFPISSYSKPFLFSRMKSSFFVPPGKKFTTGNIQVYHADKLARSMARYDASTVELSAAITKLKANQVKTLNLKAGYEIVINYLTCEVVDGLLISYNDIYNLDPLLELRLYGIKNQFAQIPVSVK